MKFPIYILLAILLGSTNEGLAQPTNSGPSPINQPVSQLLAGSGVGLSPTNGRGNVTISVTADAGLPSQTGNSGKILTTNGTTASWTSAPTGLTYNGLTVTTTTGTLTISNGKTLTVSSSLTLVGTDSTTHTFPTTSSTLARTDAAQTFGAAQTISVATGGASVSPVSGTLLQIVQANATANIVELDAFGGGITVLGRRAQGTVASPTAIGSGTGMATFAGRGYGSTGYASASRATISLQGSETWTDAAQGTKVVIGTTANTTTTTADNFVFDGSGNFSATGSLTSGAPTTGTAAPWKVGVAVTTTALVPSTTVYIQVDVSGTLYKVATYQ